MSKWLQETISNTKIRENTTAITNRPQRHHIGALPGPVFLRDVPRNRGTCVDLTKVGYAARLSVKDVGLMRSYTTESWP